MSEKVFEGVEVSKVEPAHTDERGTITDLLNKDVKNIAIIETEAGAVRGNHYHKKSLQYTYILSGKFEVSLAKAEELDTVKTITLEQGDLISILPGIVHKFTAIEKSTIIDMVSESREDGKFEDDVFRVQI